MKRLFHSACLLVLAVGGLVVFAPRPCLAELDEMDKYLRENTTRDESPAPQFGPGKVTKVYEKDLGEHDYYVVYLPEGYSPNRKWPVLFCYHGMNETPTVEPFRTLLEGRQFVIVGLGYHQAGREGYDYLKTKDVEILKRVMRSVNDHVRIHRKMLFVGGFSKGAFYAASMINNVPEAHWAGGVLLGGGMSESTVPRQRKSLYKMPIFLACGEKDPHRQYIETASDHFKDMKSDVTVEYWPRTGHEQMYPGSKLKEWMIRNGPLRNAEDRFAMAKVNEKTGKLGLALDEYQSLANVDEGKALCQKSAVAAKALSAIAQEKMDRATSAERKKEYLLAQNLLAEIESDFKGSLFGKEAADRLEKLESNPDVQKEIKQRKNKKAAEELEKKAVLAKKDGRYSEAIRLYEKYLWMYPNADGATNVKKELEKLRSDENLQKRVRDQRAARDCRGWLNMADAYIEQGKPDKAKTFLDKIVRKYPDTTWALKARVRLRNLD